LLVLQDLGRKSIAQALSSHRCFREAKKKAPEKIPDISKVMVHLFRHTVSNSILRAGVSIEGQKFLIRDSDIIMHYSTTDLVAMVKLMKKIIQKKNNTFLSNGLSGLFINLLENRAVVFLPVEAFSGHVNDVVGRS
jgi:hypothetical protein